MKENKIMGKAPCDFTIAHVALVTDFVLSEVARLEQRIGVVKDDLSLATTSQRTEPSYSRVQLAYAKAYATRAGMLSRGLNKDITEACQAFGCLENAKSWLGLD